jgi:SAM-dependent methyltransferase
MDEREEVRRAAEQRYASGADIWVSEDRWNACKRAGIERICRKELAKVTSGIRILNAGAGSHRYSWMPNQAINLDRFAAQASKLPHAVVGDLEALPFSDGEFDLVICVGPVINYASAMESISEMSRVLRPGGRLILHYETSNSAEHIFTRRWRAQAALLPTLNNGEADTVWIYSNAFMERTLRRNGIDIERRHAFHIASSALLRLGFSFDLAARAAALDHLLMPLWFLADDVIIAGLKV